MSHFATKTCILSTPQLINECGVLFVILSSFMQPYDGTV